MGALETDNARILRVQFRRMKVVIALAIVASLFGAAVAEGSAPAGYKAEVDPLDEELIQAKVDETELVQGIFGEFVKGTPNGWGKLSNIARAPKAKAYGAPQDSVDSMTAEPSEAVYAGYTNDERIEDGKDPSAHANGGADVMSKYNHNPAGNGIGNPDVPGVANHKSAAQVVRDEQAGAMARSIKELYTTRSP